MVRDPSQSTKHVESLTLELTRIKIYTGVILTVHAGVTNTIHDTVGQQHLLSAEALVGGPSRLDHKPPQITRLGQQSAKQLKSCMEACLQSTLLAQISSWLHQISQLLLPWGFLCSAGSGIAAMLQSVETGKLVRSDA